LPSIYYCNRASSQVTRDPHHEWWRLRRFVSRPSRAYSTPQDNVLVQWTRSREVATVLPDPHRGLLIAPRYIQRVAPFQLVPPPLHHLVYVAWTSWKAGQGAQLQGGRGCQPSLITRAFFKPSRFLANEKPPTPLLHPSPIGQRIHCQSRSNKHCIYSSTWARGCGRPSGPDRVVHRALLRYARSGRFAPSQPSRGCMKVKRPRFELARFHRGADLPTANAAACPGG
jgi:hypothetical protein